MTNNEALKIAKSTNPLMRGSSATSGEYVEVIIEALEKQIPKKLEDIELNEFSNTLKDEEGNQYEMDMVNVYGSCKNCGLHHDRTIPSSMYYHATEADKRVLIDYCEWCGQAIDWSDDNDK